MEKKPTILEFFSQTFTVFGIIIFLLNILSLIFGETAKEVSTIFSLGKSGISVSTALQFLIASAIIVAVKFVFMTDIIIQKMSSVKRMVFTFISIFLSVVVMIICFNWFPLNDIKAWLLFGISFISSCLASTVASWLSEKQENEKLNDALKKAKENL